MAEDENLFKGDVGCELLDANIKNCITKTIKNAIASDKNNNIERLEFCQQMLCNEKLEFLNELKQVQLMLDLKKHSTNSIAEEVKIIREEFDQNIPQLSSNISQEDMDIFVTFITIGIKWNYQYNMSNPLILQT